MQVFKYESICKYASVQLWKHARMQTKGKSQACVWQISCMPQAYLRQISWKSQPYVREISQAFLHICLQSSVVSRRGNNGENFWPHRKCSLKLSFFSRKNEILVKITAFLSRKWNVGKDYHYFIAEMEFPLRNKPSFSLNLLIIGVMSTALSQKICGWKSLVPRKASIISRSGLLYHLSSTILFLLCWLWLQAKAKIVLAFWINAVMGSIFLA